MKTYTGKIFDYENLSPDNVDIEDIAHSLSNLCRFCGHISEHYSVAQHSVLASIHVVDSQYNGIEALLHDATEAYMADVPSPAKKMLPGYRALENKIWKEAIAPKFNLSHYMSQAVHNIDKILLEIEMNQLFYDKNSHDPLFIIEPLPPKEAKELFLQRYKELTGE
jgi:hypothetical protein